MISPLLPSTARYGSSWLRCAAEVHAPLANAAPEAWSCRNTPPSLPIHSRVAPLPLSTTATACWSGCVTWPPYAGTPPGQEPDGAAGVVWMPHTETYASIDWNGSGLRSTPEHGGEVGESIRPWETSSSALRS